jgi:hypothetical protein
VQEAAPSSLACSSELRVFWIRPRPASVPAVGLVPTGGDVRKKVGGCAARVWPGARRATRASFIGQSLGGGARSAGMGAACAGGRWAPCQNQRRDEGAGTGRLDMETGRGGGVCTATLRGAVSGMADRSAAQFLAVVTGRRRAGRRPVQTCAMLERIGRGKRKRRQGAAAWRCAGEEQKKQRQRTVKVGNPSSP